TNVVMSVLAGRALLLHPPAIADAEAAAAILDCFTDRHELDEDEVQAFAGNCLAVTDQDVLLSQRAADALRPASRAAIESWGFRLHPVDVSEIERAGGSVRCMLGEIY
ncbi:MAG: arginine deiminase-related protein, partial [Pseudomonadota bacterium]